MENIVIRKASVDDAEKLLEIYSPYVLNTAISFEYDVPSVEEFRERIINISKNYPYLVLLKDNEIAGYIYASAFHPRKAYYTSVEISIYLQI